MKLQLNPWWAVLALFACLGLATACDDDAGGGNQNSDTLPDAPDGVDVNIESSMLTLVEPTPGTALRMLYGGQDEIKVRFSGPDNVPIVGAILDFSIVASTDNCGSSCLKLDAFAAPTGADGTCVMKVSSPLTWTKDADITVRVAVQNNTAVDPVDALVQLRAKESYDLRVEFEYSGSRTFTEVKPMLFQAEASCADVFTAPLRNPALLPTAARQNPATPRKTDGSIEPSVFTSLPNATQYIAVGFAETEAGLVTVYGCNDERPSVGNGVGVTITVQLNEVPILLAGTYELVSNFDLLSGLPRRNPAEPDASMEAGDWVDFVVLLFKNPGEAILTVLGPYIEDLAGFNIPAGLDGVVAGIINDAIQEFAPDWVNNALIIGGDISELVTSLQLVGELIINEEPDAVTGLIPAGQRHRYYGVNFRWRLNCANPQGGPTACRQTLRFNEDPINRADLAFEGTFSGAVTNCTATNGTCIVINQHGMTIPYGEIALAVIEGWVLPALFNDVRIDSLESFVNYVLLEYLIRWYNDGRPTNEQVDPSLGCESVGTIIANLAGLEGFTGGIVDTLGEYACEEGRTFLVNLIRENAAKLTLETGDNLQLASSGDCKLLDTEGDLEWDKMGDGLNDGTRCDWAIKFRWSATSNVVDLAGKFHAER